MLNDKLIENVDDHRYENGIPCRSEAMRRLLDEALKKYGKKAKKQPFIEVSTEINPSLWKSRMKMNLIVA
ncbi:MAG TPA: hypothetical protein VMW06_05360 [Desulfobacterales bacterium]|nr:hypothetical protein [Desulfobacterales bacterium]